MRTKDSRKVFMIIFIICILVILGLALARYIKQVNGTANANLAKYVFKINGSTNQNFVIDLGTTRTGTQEADIEQGYIGPGTSGMFTLALDSSRK